MNSPQKHYVVWKGRRPGIYAAWADAKRQVDGYVGAQYKAFPSRAAAEAAYQERAADHIGQAARKPSAGLLKTLGDSYVVDAACRGYPGPLEIRGVHLPDLKQVFHRGPYAGGSVNVGEFLALVHILAWLQGRQLSAPVYSDSETALVWLSDKHCKTRLERTAANTRLFELIERAEAWLRTNTYPNKVSKWDTEEWGENPADFGRK